MILVLFSILEYYSRTEKKKKQLFFLSSSILLLFCVLRYNVGFDYDSYEYVYSKLPASFDINYDLSGITGEILFLYIFMLLKSIGVSYPIANSLIILTINLLFLRFISKHSLYKCFSLLILFSLYFVFIFSTLRQGLSMSLFLGFAFPLLEEKKYIKYYITILILTLIHTSIVVTCILTIVMKYKNQIKSFDLILLFVCFAIALIPNPILLNTAETIGRGEGYITSTSISYFALFNRTLLFIFIYIFCKPETGKYANMKYFYFIGFLLYIVTAQSDLISSRISASIKTLDMILIPLVLHRLPQKFYPVFMVLISIYMGIIFMHLISGIATLSGYNNGWEYPYKMLLGNEYYFDRK